MLVGYPPFNEQNFMKLKDRVTNCEYQLPQDMDLDAADIIRQLLMTNPDHRLGTNSNFSQLKGHPFFKGIDFDKLLKGADEPVWKPS